MWNFFMKEKIFYVSDDYAEKLVKTYTGANREQMIKNLNNDLTGKNASINKLNEELSHCRNQIEFERKQNLKYFALKSEDKAEIQIHKISSENTSLKTSLLNYEETISSLSNTNKMLLAEKNEI